MSSAMDDSDVAATTVLLLPERLANLMRLAGSERESIELHQ